MPSDIDIANAATLRRITDIARDTLGIDADHLVPYGHFKAKVDLSYLATPERSPDGQADPDDRAVADPAR